MALYQLRTIQKVPSSKEEVWRFLSDPMNLSRITPDMGFQILSGADRAMYPGQIIQYYVSPFSGLKIHWVTEITHVKEGEYFVDEQRFGPYALWHHKHFIKEVPGGVEMEDIVDYKLPMSLLGDWMNSWVVSRKLTRIFEYRWGKLEELLGSIPQQEQKIRISKFG